MKRREAFELNLKRYKTGKPCKNGHVAERFTSTGVCCECFDLTYENLEKVKILREDKKIRKEAKEKGEVTYFSPKPCHKGHFLRYSNRGDCVECLFNSGEAAKERHKAKKKAERMNCE